MAIGNKLWSEHCPFPPVSLGKPFNFPGAAPHSPSTLPPCKIGSATQAGGDACRAAKRKDDLGLHPGDLWMDSKLETPYVC